MATRSPDEIRASIQHNRIELARSLDMLRGKVREATDWRAQVRRNRTKAIVGAAVAGFVVAGGVAGMSALLRRRSG